MSKKSSIVSPVTESGIPLSVPGIRGNEWKYVKECLDTGWVSSAGKYVSRFEEDICAFSGAEHAVACVNATAALQVALRLVGVSPGDEVIVPTVTFIAPVNAVRYLDAAPVFMDCDDHFNIDAEKTVRFIERETVFRDGHSWNRRTLKRVQAIIPVHVFGNAVDLEKIIPVCRQRNIRVVEDAAESLGSYYAEGSLSGKHTGVAGDIGCYSFNGNKIITTGGGGMIVTGNDEYAEKARYLTTQAKDDQARYIHDEVGYNFRLSNIQAAVGVAQLEMLPEYIRIKEKNYSMYRDEIDKMPGLHLAGTPAYARSNYWFYCMLIDKGKYGMDREELMALLAGKNIETRPIWQLNHLQKPYRDFQHYEIEKAFELLERTLNIPCSVTLREEDIRRVISALKGR